MPRLPEQGKLQESIFSPGAKRVAAVISHEEAIYLNHNYVGIEHLLLALLTAAKEKTIAPVFDVFNLDIERVRRQVWFFEIRGEKPVTEEVSKYTPRAITAISLAVEESVKSGAKKINSIHLLIGLVREGEGQKPQGVATHILARNGIDSSQLEKLRELAKKLEDPAVSKEETESDSHIQSLNRLKNRISQDPTLDDKVKTRRLKAVDRQIKVIQEAESEQK